MPLVELGAPPEYVPVVKPNALHPSGTAQKVAEAATAAAARMIASEKDEVMATKRETPIGRPDGTLAREAALDLDAPAALVSSGSVDDAEYVAVAISAFADGATTAVPDTAQVAPSTINKAKLLKAANVITPSVDMAGAPTFPEGEAVPAAHREEERARAQEKKEAVKMFVEEMTTSVAQEEDRGRMVGPAYARASREFARLGDCMTPAAMLVVVKSGTKFLFEDAARISVS